MIGNTAAHAGLERDRPVSRAGLGEDLRAVLGQQRLVGGDDMLAGLEAVEHDLQGRLDAPHQLDDDLDFRVVDQSADLVREPDAVERDAARLLRSRTTAHFQRMRLPARRAIRSACSVRIRATPVPTVPSPISPMVTCSMSFAGPVRVVAPRARRIWRHQ